MRQRQLLLMKRGVSLCVAATFAAFALLPSAEAKYGDPKDPKWKRPGKVVITSPANGSRLPNATRMHIKGTGEANPRVGGWRLYNISGKMYINYTSAEGKRVLKYAPYSGNSFHAVTDKHGNWENKTVTLLPLKEGWSDVTYEISVTQSAREERDDHPTLEVNPLSSEATVIQVQPFQQPKPKPGNSEGISNPTGPGKKDTPAPSAAGVTHLQIISPAHNSEVEPTIRINGLAQAGTNVRVTVKRRMDSAVPDRGRKRFTKRKVSITVGTFTARVDGKNQWEIPPVHLKPVQTEKTEKMDYTKIDFVITAVQIDSKGNESKPVERVVKPFHADFW